MTINHKKQWDFLGKKLESNQLSHAYLFTGSKEIGKKDFAIEFAKLLSCQNKEKPCQNCVNCQMIGKNSFPDFKILCEKNEKDSIFGDGGEIKVSQVREIQNFLSYKSYYGSFKIVIVDEAEKMNQEAQNCFLKSLEEPKGSTIIMMISSKPDLLLPTITSRCQTIKFFKSKNSKNNTEKLEAQEEILKDLLLVADSSLAEKFKYVKSIDFEKHNAQSILEVFQKYLRHLLMVKIGIDKPNSQDERFKKYSINELKKILNLVEDLNKKLIFTNASEKLALEILLMEL